MGRSMGKELEEERLIELMLAYQAGRIEAFESLYKHLKPTLYQYLLYKTLNQTLAEDLLQESFLQLHRSRRTYLPGKPVLPWALAIARNVCRMEWRSRRRRETHETSEEPSLPEAASMMDLDRLADRQFLREALARLTADQREIILMHHALGLSFQEIAGILGILRTTAKLRAHRAIKRLREILGVSNVTSRSPGQSNKTGTETEASND
jgi:RNA polymerase sigma-70 factor (ECF subfamily)